MSGEEGRGMPYTVPGRRCKMRPPTVARIRPSVHIGANQAAVRSGEACRTCSMLR